MPIKNAYNEQCAFFALSVIPDHESVQVQNRTLDGKIHIQTTGDPIKTADVRCLATLEEFNVLSDSAAKGIPVQIDLDTETAFYDGLILGQPTRSLGSRGNRGTRAYNVNFRMHVTE